MKIQWAGFAHGTEPLKYDFDNFGLANENYLKFKTDSETDEGNGAVKTSSFIAVLSEGNPCANRPASASRLVVRNLIRNFRDECRTKQFSEMKHERWLKFQFSQIQDKMLAYGEANPEYEGFSASCTCVIVNENIAYIAQLGNTRLYQLREDMVIDLSNGKSAEQPTESFFFQRPGVSQSEQMDFLQGMLGVPAADYIEPHIYIADVQKKDVLCFCTNGLDVTIGAKGFKTFFEKVWNPFNFRSAARHMIAQGVRTCNDACVGSLLLRFC